MFRIIPNVGRALLTLAVPAVIIFAVYMYVAGMDVVEMRQAAGLDELGPRDLFSAVVNHMRTAFEPEDSGFGVTWE